MALLSQGVDSGNLKIKDHFQNIVYFRLACAKGAFVIVSA
jgi:hypothetical protein